MASDESKTSENITSTENLPASSTQITETPPSGSGTASGPTEKVLPAVAPPSGRFIAQLFLIPGMIVAVLVFIYLLGSSLVSERRDPEYFLGNLDSTNQDKRWRAAHDLAQVLKRPESIEMASNPEFALGLAERLYSERAALRAAETKIIKDTLELSDEERNRQLNQLSARRKHVLFLTSCLGDFTIPVGAPLLADIAEKGYGFETKLDPENPAYNSNVLLRRRALWALANLGANLQKFEKELSEEKQQVSLEVLEVERSKKRSKRQQWANQAFRYLTDNTPLGVDEALAKAGESEDLHLRKLVAFALNFWDGDVAEDALIKLSQDYATDGRYIKVEEAD
ncbi:MAG: hypothetical protein ACFCD0_15935 [Gemmataceae bacterium]